MFGPATANHAVNHYLRRTASALGYFSTFKRSSPKVKTIKKPQVGKLSLSYLVAFLGLILWAMTISRLHRLFLIR